MGFFDGHFFADTDCSDTAWHFPTHQVAVKKSEEKVPVCNEQELIVPQCLLADHQPFPAPFIGKYGSWIYLLISFPILLGAKMKTDVDSNSDKSGLIFGMTFAQLN